MNQAVDEVRALLDEASGTTAQFWSDAQLESWINQGAADVARRGETLWQETYINVTPNVQTYAFPSDFLEVHKAEFTLSGGAGPASNQTWTLEFREIVQMDEMWGILHNLPAAYPQFFTIRANSTQGFFLMTYPAPGAQGILTVYYYRQAQAVSGNQQLDTLPAWQDIVFDYAVYKALRAAREPAWQEAFQLYEKNLAEMISKTRTMSDQAQTVISGASNFPLYAYAGGVPDYYT